MDTKLYWRACGKVKGPFSLAELQQQARKGRVQPSHEVSPDRLNWVAADRYPDLFPRVPAIRPLRQPVVPPQGAAPALAPVPARSMAPDEVITIGREGSCDVVVDTLAVSKRHLTLRRTAAGITAADLGSTTGTYINGARLTQPRVLATGDNVSLGGAQFTFDGDALVSRPPDLGFAVRADAMGREVTDRGTGRARMLIQDVTLTLRPGEFTALVGASGAGKSTLFGALSGRARATHGCVTYDGHDLYAHFEGFRAAIGYVPQRDVFHDVLPVVDALRATSCLRLSRDTTSAEIDANIDRVLRIVSLSERRDTVIANLSGGEQKRVAIALELLSRPKILFLDEPTAPLDPRTTTQMMKLFRGLAEGGITVVMITHAANSLSLCDTVAYMHKGLLTFHGPPEMLKAFFGVNDMGEAYAAEERKAPQQWRAEFLASPDCRAFAASREASPRNSVPAGKAATAVRRRGDVGWADMWNQTKVLTRRYVRTQVLDRRSLSILVMLAPVVATLLCLVTSSINTSSPNHNPEWYQNYIQKQKMLCFGSVVIVMFLSLFASVREIVKELPVYLHEHFVNVEIVPYLISKVVPLLVIGATQTGLVVAVVTWLGGSEAGPIWLQLISLFLCSAVGTMLGLMISALVSQSDRAVTGMIMVVIPEILFTGALIPVKGAAKVIAGPLVTAYWGLHALMAQLPPPPFDVAILPEALRQKYSSTPQACGMMFVHFTAAALLTYFLMVRKDSPDAADKIASRLKKNQPRSRKRKRPTANPAAA